LQRRGCRNGFGSRPVIIGANTGEYTENRGSLLKYITLLLIALSLTAAIGAGAGRVDAVSQTFVVNSTDNTGDGNHGDGFCDTAPPGPLSHFCTLRSALEEAKQTPDTDTIKFNIPDTG